MANISLLKRLTTIFNLVISKSFFVTLFVILFLTIVILTINIKWKSKAPKYAAAIAYIGMAVLVLARYSKYVLSLNDSIVDKFFRAMYFPNLVVYSSMLIVTILLLTFTILDEKFSLFSRICNYSCFFVIWFLFILVIDTIKQEKLNFYEVTEIYANSTVMILLQASMCIFAVWCGVIIVDLIVRKLSSKMDKNKKFLDEADLNDFAAVGKNSDVDSIINVFKDKENENEEPIYFDEIPDYKNNESNDDYTQIL